MTKIRCVVIDDEPLAVKVLENYIRQVAQLERTASFTNAVDYIAYPRQKEVDLLFLDINMPKLSGIGLLKSLQHTPLVIFTTAYPEYAVESFELETLDYLLKPFSFERFLKAVNKACEQIEIRQALQSLQKNKSPAHLAVKADRKLYKINFADILYLQAFGDYIKIFTSGKTIVPKERLNNIERQLPAEKFLRIHRSYIISLNAIQYLEGNHIAIFGKKIPIGHTYKEGLLKKLK